MHKIKNIVFDLGGVILNINPDLAGERLAFITKKNKNDLLSELATTGVIQKVDTGEIDANTFRTELKRVVSPLLSNAQIDECWNAILLDFPEKRIETLREVAKNYRIFLLSNTNSIHYEKYVVDFEKKFGFAMQNMFEKMYLSYEIGHHKPDKEVFDYVIKDKNLKPEETLLIDDTQKNVESSLKSGWQGIHINKGQDMVSLFENGKLKKPL